MVAGTCRNCHSERPARANGLTRPYHPGPRARVLDCPPSPHVLRCHPPSGEVGVDPFAIFGASPRPDPGRGRRSDDATASPDVPTIAGMTTRKKGPDHDQTPTSGLHPHPRRPRRL